jgi:hypothetical protein
LMAHFGKEGVSEMSVPRLSQETLAEMVGTTRSRVSFFMNRFRKLGFINYDVGHNLRVHSSLLNVVLHDDALDDESRIARGYHGLELSERRGGIPENERARRPPLSSLNEIGPDLSVGVAPRDSCTQIERYPTVRYGPA